METPERINLLPALIGFLVYLLLNPIVLFLSAWTLDWPMAWVYTGLMFASTIISRLIAFKKHPDMLRERARYAEGEGAKKWDQAIVRFVGLIGPLIISLVAGLDHNFDWGAEVSFPIQVAAVAVVTVGFGLGVWAMAVNRFFSAVVRIQAERGHTVVTDGPYRIVRHPSYAGALLAYLSIPLMLDALWAYAAILPMIVLLFVRTALEDRTLRQELAGYEEYTQQTRYRLLPGVW